jgi:putative ABC transport system permease protein
MIVSILIAFMIFGVLAGVYASYTAGEDRAADDRLVVVNKVNFTQPLPYAYYNRVRSVPGVRKATYAIWFGGYYQDPKNVLIVMAVEPETYTDIFSRDFDLAPEARQAFIRQRDSAIVGADMAKKWGWKVGDRVPVSSNIFSQKNGGGHVWDFSIVGIFTGKAEQNGTDLMFFQYDYFDETRSFLKDTIGWLVLQTENPADNDRVAKAIDAMFVNSTAETSTDTEKAFNKAFAAQFGNIALIVILVVGAAFITILMIVGNTMALSIRERTREIGVLKTLGFSGSHVLGLVLGESVLLALLGGLPGLALAWGITASLRPSVSAFLPGFALTPGIAAEALVLMLVLGVVTGIAPALSAWRLRISTALGRV